MAHGEDNILRITHASLSGGQRLFTRDEVMHMDIVPLQEVEIQQVQSRDIRVYYNGGEHYVFTIEFAMVSISTLVKLNDIRDLQDTVGIYPFWFYDQVTTYDVVWINPDAFVETYYHGYPAAHDGADQYIIEVIFREPMGAVCIPPS